MMLSKLLSLADVAEKARARLPSPIAGFVDGGTEDCVSLRSNRAAFERIMLLPRGLAGVEQRSLEIMLWGAPVALPFGIAPMGVMSICRRRCDIEVARAAHQSGIPFILSGLSNVPLEEVKKVNPDPWYQAYLPGDDTVIASLADRLEAAGIEKLVVTIDTCVAANRENNERAGFTLPFAFSPRLIWDGLTHPRWTTSVFLNTLLRDGIPRFTNVTADRHGYAITEMPQGGFRAGRDRLSWDHIRRLRERWPGQLVLKGVSHPADALLAVDHGIDGIILSNHGGRQLDGAIAPLDILPTIIGMTPPGYPVMIDGGFRRGTDILKAYALGAAFVFIGRPMLHGAAIAGTQEVARVIEILRTELDRDLALLGCRAMSDLSPDCLVRVQTERP
ncbi:MAG: alpha-hydroxy-acid oxidizing enzyme [Alphaproteobacteria bacterium HGW-Alphaproteobacteria-5]|jgi:L-lactate dehydrogenase (cytochrome)|nr:MAG: alpha-hydroxy-acid oxidizing enzyme [Alphaproteobacteria bacterium HGW-Alphaproteobacteria-5]